MAELRSFIFLNRLQPQTMCYLGTWIRGSLPRSYVAAQIIEFAPGLDMSGATPDVLRAQQEITAVLGAVEGREHGEG